MTFDEAFEIVLDLARENIIDDPDMKKEKEKQLEAIDLLVLYMANLQANFLNAHLEAKEKTEALERTEAVVEAAEELRKEDWTGSFYKLCKALDDVAELNKNNV